MTKKELDFLFLHRGKRKLKHGFLHVSPKVSGETVLYIRRENVISDILEKSATSIEKVGVANGEEESANSDTQSI